MLEGASDAFELPAVAFAASDEWLAALERLEPLTTAELESHLRLRRTQTLRQLHRAEELGLLRSLVPTRRGAKTRWQVTGPGRQLARQLRKLTGDPGAAAPAPQAARVGVATLLPASPTARSADTVADLSQALLRALPSGPKKHELFVIQVHHLADGES